MAYAEMSVLPEYELIRVGDNGLPMESEGKVRWGGKTMPVPPAIGERIKVTMNSLGPAVVLGYFTEGGFLGLLVKLEEPPAWWKKQNAKALAAGEIKSHVFGIEIAPL